MQITNNRLHQKMRTSRTTRTTMEHSSTQLSSSANVSVETTARQNPRVHPEEPFLYYIPEGVHPIYRPLPLLVKLFVLLFSMWTSALTTWKRLSWVQPLAVLRGLLEPPRIADILSFAAKTLVVAICSQCILQEIFLAPSRLDIATLLEKYFLPSPLSKYDSVSLPFEESTKDLGVHVLKYSSKEIESRPTRFKALYLNHGFGASSLSWLPAIPSLVNRLGARVGLAHDAVGFGFTDRPEEIALYTTGSSASIGTQVLIQNEGTTTGTPGSVALFGHSLGALTTLKMALKIPKETSKFIVLSAPALGFSKTRRPTSRPSSLRRKVLNPVGKIVQEGILYPVGGYVLRRVVGTKNFWRKGLQAAWGDPKKLLESDVLRFQWPSIGKGWERGLFHFSRAQMGDEMDDVTLLRRVLALPNTTVAVILGSKDKVVPPRMTKKFLQDFESIPIVELEGLGHDAFEEDVEAFLGAVDELLDSWDKVHNL